MKHYFRNLLTIAFVGLVTPAAAQQSAGQKLKSLSVLELFTSQGCSSCPPADAVFQSYAKRQDVVALSMPVDYWDYLGWKDTLANPAFSRRQRNYARTRGDGAVYTPQVIINGQQHYIGSSRREIDGGLQTSSPEQAVVSVAVRENPGELNVELEAIKDGPIAPYSVWLVAVQREIKVEVQAGENRGRTVTYFNVVREISNLGIWKGGTVKLSHQFQVAAPNLPSYHYALLVQKTGGNEIIHASWLGKTGS